LVDLVYVFNSTLLFESAKAVIAGLAYIVAVLYPASRASWVLALLSTIGLALLAPHSLTVVVFLAPLFLCRSTKKTVLEVARVVGGFVILYPLYHIAYTFASSMFGFGDWTSIGVGFTYFITSPGILVASAISKHSSEIAVSLGIDAQAILLGFYAATTLLLLLATGIKTYTATSIVLGLALLLLPTELLARLGFTFNNILPLNIYSIAHNLFAQNLSLFEANIQTTARFLVLAATASITVSLSVNRFDPSFVAYKAPILLAVSSIVLEPSSFADIVALSVPIVAANTLIVKLVEKLDRKKAKRVEVEKTRAKPATSDASRVGVRAGFEKRVFKVIADTNSTISSVEAKPISKGVIVGGKYLLVERIGEGAYAEVWLARDDKGKLYAVKIFKPIGGRLPSTRELLEFYRDVEELLKLVGVEVDIEHVRRRIPRDIAERVGGYESLTKLLNRYRYNIIAVKDFNSRAYLEARSNPDKPYYASVEDYWRDPPYIVMEYADAGNLRSRRDKVVANWKTFSKIVEEVAGALAYYYVVVGGVHRDVKPENILLSRRKGELVALVSDFGIATPIGYRREEWVLGTPPYMPPEHLLYPGRGVTPAFDVYSFGSTFYEILVGDIPPTQYALLAITKHPMIKGQQVQEMAKNVLDKLTLAYFGSTAEPILVKLEEIVYPKNSQLLQLCPEAVRLQNEALKKLSSKLKQSSSPLNMLWKLAEENLLREARRRNLPDRIAKTILSCLEVDPSKRPRSMVEVLLALKNLV